MLLILLHSSFKGVTIGSETGQCWHCQRFVSDAVNRPSEVVERFDETFVVESETVKGRRRLRIVVGQLCILWLVPKPRIVSQ
jgi:hypothetical protein